jgi:hypothetical protein
VAVGATFVHANPGGRSEVTTREAVAELGYEFDYYNDCGDACSTTRPGQGTRATSQEAEKARHPAGLSRCLGGRARLGVS